MGVLDSVERGAQISTLHPEVPRNWKLTWMTSGQFSHLSSAAPLSSSVRQIISLDSADALLFDLGGVVIETDFDRVFARWAAHSSHHLHTIKAKFSFDDFYQRHER